LNALGCDLKITEYDIGQNRYRATGELLPNEVLHHLRGKDAVYVGTPPVGGVDTPVGVLDHEIVFALRARLDLAVMRVVW
jgi:3-isopropylmalate dehydrogenase